MIGKQETNENYINKVKKMILKNKKVNNLKKQT